MKLSSEKRNLLIGGAIIGAVAAALMAFGNPKNMGFCIACFVRDISGAMKFHSAAAVQYVRPEIIGLVFGSFILAVLRGEFRPRGGSSPVLRFFISALVMIGALVFLGCPFRMIIRLAAGDLNALVGLFGFIAGIAVGTFFLSQGFSLGRYQKQSVLEGAALPFANVVLLVVSLAAPALFAASTSGPGSMHAPIIISLIAGLIVGAIAQRTRLCMVGGIRDTILVKDPTLLYGYLGIFVVLLVFNLATGRFNLGFANQPIAHSDHLFNFLGMALAGLGSVMLGGCPLRQIILAGEGNSDSAVAVLGLVAGAAISHNFGLAGAAASADSAGGASAAAKVVVICGIIFLCLLAVAKIYLVRREER